MKTVNFILNGKQTACEVRDNETLLLMLRERLSVTSVKEGCSIGECGVCTVLIDDEPHYACLTLASKIEGRNVKTVEFLGNNDLLHPLQQSFISQGAVQCGYCTPGMLLVAYSLLLKNPKATEEEIRIAISGNLCRCTGYIQIIEAVKDAAAVTAGSREEPTADRRPSETRQTR
jgi:aerobic-type carbon monoxide dehydrogenase small subunit (CoxS/CutS family)